MDVKVIRQNEAETFYEGVELCRLYYKTPKITFGTSTLKPGETGAVDLGHKASHEVFFVVEGSVILRTPNTDAKYELHEGDAIIMPESVPHELTNIGEDTAVVSWSLAPSEF
ncbi:MAG: cupin domain-containing protein [Oscillospiraceae bacterium]|jgi:mannose-6-phosphate isomerase-like protein (cupin superfamily)|nr:cupin domain-containing protein [Oscillospiraceae bacterium]